MQRKNQRKRWTERWDKIPLQLMGASPVGGTEEGLSDFRGGQFQGTNINGLSIADADLSYANFDQVEFRDCNFLNCRFENAILTRISTWASSFEGCNFTRADFRASVIGFNGTEFRNCNFDRVSVRRTSFLNAVFRDIVFDAPCWNHTYFNGSGFWNCIFRGNFRDVMFLGRYLIEKSNLEDPKNTGLHAVDFSQATLRSVGVRAGCILQDITIPADGGAFICDVRRLLDFYSHLHPESYEHKLLSDYLYITQTDPKDQPLQIMSKNDLVEAENEEAGTHFYTAIKSKIAIKV